MHIGEAEFEKLYPTLKKVHFIGIVSPFSSFCATHLISKGIKITASEFKQDVDSAKDWIKKGILYPGAHNADYITDDIDLVIVPNGAPKDHVEVVRAQKLGIPHIMIQELLGYLSKTFKTIAIAGTHGKTTTTALIIWLMHKTIGTPNFIVGDSKDKIGGDLQTNWESHPESDFLVIEACEYRKQFLARAPSPYISVITHIDLDHTDFYKSQEEYNTAFIEFLGPTSKSIIIDTEQKNESNVISALTVDQQIIPTSKLKLEFGYIESSLPGKHNQENLIRAVALGLELGIPRENILSALSSFPGITARFELIGETKKGAKVYWDYAHNPEKVTACLQGAREMFPKKKICAVYQPHNYERTFTTQKGLIKSLNQADIIIIPNIYSLRETDEVKKIISVEDIAEKIRLAYPDKEVILTNDKKPFSKTAETILQITQKDSVIVLISAGDLPYIKDSLINK